MAESSSDAPFALSLRPWPAENADADSIPQLQSRMFSDRGHFRHITEAGLEEEIRAAEAGETQDEDDSDAEDTKHEPTEKERMKKLLEAKGEMIAYLQQAHQEAMISRDFISLLISKDSPKTAQLSLSEAVKTAVPVGSLTWSKWEQPLNTMVPAEQQHKDALAAEGARMKSLSNTADTLLQAATRLENDVRRETKYWEQVLSITEKGWSVRRIPQERFNLGVQLGFAEAGEQFKRRGFTPLRTDESGGLILDEELTKAQKTIRVRVLQHDQVVGTSRLPKMINTNHAEIEDLIGRARDSLFDEELFYEMALETRALLSYQVKMRDSVIRVPLGQSSTNEPPNREVLIDLLELDDTFQSSQSHESDDLAQNIATALRLLLSNVHRQRLHRRSELPPPLSSRKEQKPPEPILRPLMSYFAHRHETTRVRQYFEKTCRTLESASLYTSYTYHTDSKILDISKTLKQPSATSSPISSLVSPFIQPLQTTLSIGVPSARSSAVPPSTAPPAPTVAAPLVLTITTILAPPTFGTTFSLALPANTLPATPAARTVSLSNFAEVTSYIDDILAIDIAHHVLGKVYPTLKGKDRKSEIDGTLSSGTKTTKGHSGNKVEERGAVKVEVKDGMLKVFCGKMKVVGTNRKEIAEDFTWGGEEESKGGLKEMVAKVFA